MRLVNKIVLATLNRHKFEEFQALFRSSMKTPAEVELITPQAVMRNSSKLQFAERHSTYLENAAAKARLVNQGCHYPSLADDSGLEVEALDQRPGVRSHRYASPKPHLTQDQANVQLLLTELKGATSRKARFVTTLALVVEGILIQTTGTLEGEIIEEPRGENGFGYDPVFIPAGSTKTLAEMSDTEKNSLSHRGKALQLLLKEVESHGIAFAKP